MPTPITRPAPATACVAAAWVAAAWLADLLSRLSGLARKSEP